MTKYFAYSKNSCTFAAVLVLGFLILRLQLTYLLIIFERMQFMKKKFTFSVMAFLLLSITMWANTPLSLHVHQTSGSIYSAALNDVALLTFASGELVIQTTTAQKIPLSGIKKVTFDKINTAIREVEDLSCRAFVNGDKMLIVNAEQPIYNLQIVSLTGQVVLAEAFANRPNELATDVQSLAQGTYFVILQTVMGNASAKIMIH